MTDDRMTEQRNKRSMRRLIIHFAALMVFIIAFLSVTSALVEPYISVDNNVYATGEIKLNLNDGMAVINPEEYNFEPGMTVAKPFFVKNIGTWQAYYRIYLDGIKGSLAPILEVKLENKTTGETVYNGTLADMTRNNTALNNKIDVGETQDFLITFHYPEIEGNRGQGTDVSFVLKADTTQTKNNPAAEYE